MIKALRITSYVAAVLAVIFFVLPVVMGVRSDEEIEKSVNSPSVIEKFNKTVGNKAKKGQSQTSPLVKQAESFALYLNPPKPKVSKAARGNGGRSVTRGPVVTPKFKVVGISYNNDRPESSIVLIDEPGKGLHWLRQSGKIGHLIVDQIKDGVIVLNNGGRTYEMAAEQKQELSLLEGASGASTAPSKQEGVSDRAKSVADYEATKTTLPDIKKSKPGVTRVIDGPQQQRKSGVLQRRSPEEEAKYRKLVGQLRKIQRSSDKAGSGPSEKERAEMIDKIISQFNASRLTIEEAKKLDTLDKESKKVSEESDSSHSKENGDKK